jgi:predicted ribosome quality control (RQC) complex YloA/Tae2 family protein
MTEQEFDQQVWRRFDVVTTDTGIETTVMNVCFSTRSVRIYVKNAPAEWLPFKRIVAHTTRKGDTADEGTIIEELHNRIMKQDDKIARLENEKAALAEKISRNYLKDILQSVNMLKDGLTEKKHKLEKIERGLDLIVSTLARIDGTECLNNNE